jgi:hypothetical protein
MTLQEEILSIQEYFRSVEYFGKGIVVKVEFPSKWSVYPSNDEKIKVAPDDNIPNVFFYFTDLSEGTLEEVFSLIRETAEMNINAVKKIELMKEKIEELKEIFASKTIEELQNLKFTFEEEKKTKRKYTKKKKEEKVEDTEEKITEETETVTENE